MHHDNCECQKFLRGGLEAMQNGEWKKAKMHYEKALAVHEDSCPAWGNLAHCYLELGDEEKALECCDKALSYDPYYKHALVNKGGILARRKEFQEAVNCFSKALQSDPTFEIAKLNLQRALAEMGCTQEPLALKVVSRNGRYCLEAGDELLTTPQGHIIDATSPELLEAIISDIAGQGQVIVENGVLLSPRCTGTYAFASTAIDFFADGNPLDIAEWLSDDPVFSPTAGHPIVAMSQRQPKVELLLKERNLTLKVREQYGSHEWGKVVSFLQGVVNDLTAGQKSVLVNLAWPNGGQFVVTIMYLTGRYSEREWAEAIFSRSDDVDMIIGERNIGQFISVPDELGDDERQNEYESLIEGIMENILIAKRYLEITKGQ